MNERAEGHNYSARVTLSVTEGALNHNVTKSTHALENMEEDGVLVHGRIINLYSTGRSFVHILRCHNT
jgi:hypothetical protein